MATKREPANPGVDFVQAETDLNRYPVHTLPLSLAPIKSLGLRACVGLNGWPSNRMVSVSGPPHAGKSLLTWMIANEYIKNDDLVVISEVENALDRDFMAQSFEYDAELSEDQRRTVPLEYMLKECQKVLDQQEKLRDPKAVAKKKEEIADAKKIIADAKKFKKKAPKEVQAVAKESGPVLLNERQLAQVELRRDNFKRMIKGEPIIIPGISDGEEIEFATRKLLETAQAEYKLRKVLFNHPGTLEEFEAEFFRIVGKRDDKEELRNKRLLWIVDSASALLPDVDIEKKSSSEGNSFGAAKYFRTMLPRINYEIGIREISIIWVNHQNVFLGMNPYEYNSDIKKTVFRGGDGQKFGSTFMITLEERKDALDMNGDKIKAGKMEMPKSKLRGGSNATLEAIYFIHEGKAPTGYAEFDMDTPFLVELLGDENVKKGVLGLQKAGKSAILVPENLLKDHPQFAEKLEPSIAKVTETDDTRYYKSTSKELIADRILIDSPSFHKAVIMLYEIAGTI